MADKTCKWLGSLKMTWGKVILIALFSAVFCGIFGGMPALSDTSFTDMAGGYEWWVFCAVLIVVNCKSFWDAGLKCGLFFLISQVGMFYLQALLYTHNYGNALYYTKLWLPIIALTVPGGMIAYFCKKDNIWGAIVLGIGNAILLAMCVTYTKSCLASFPRHLLSAVFSASCIAVLTLSLQKKKVNRMIAFGLPVLLVGALLIYASVKHLVF